MRECALETSATIRNGTSPCFLLQGLDLYKYIAPDCVVASWLRVELEPFCSMLLAHHLDIIQAAGAHFL